jgi:DNA-binding response OmpR family regulator
MRVLLLEDSARLRDLLGETLRDAGYGLDVVSTAHEFRSTVTAVSYDLLIVDLGLPDGDGIELIKELRAAGNATPVLVITARVTITDRIAGLDSGADDYLIKPFNHAELVARVRALLRRPSQITGPELRIGRLSLREATGEVFCDQNSLELRPSERRLLSVLMRRAGSVLLKSGIEETLSEFGREVTPNAVEVLVSRLRKALHDADAGVSLVTVRGLGYILKESS